MTTLQDAINAMSVTAVSFLNLNKAITDKMPNFAAYLTEAQATNDKIYTTKVQQEAEFNANNKAKKLLRKSLVASSINIDRRIVAYATQTDNNDLLAQVNHTESTLNRLSDQKLIRCCQIIHDNARANASALIPYGITEAIITEQQTILTSFGEAIPQERLKTTDSGETTKLLTSLFKQLADIWAKIDTMVEMERTSNPNFYNEYHKVRKVIVLGKGSLSLKVKITNAQTDQPEPNVTLTLTPITTRKTAAKGKDTIVKKTAKGGGAHMKNVPDGTYMLTAQKVGITDVSQTVNIVNGEMTTINLKVDKA